jgi:hypothetical protein
MFVILSESEGSSHSPAVAANAEECHSRFFAPLRMTTVDE